MNESTGAGIGGEMRGHFRKATVPRRDDDATTVKPENFWRTFERTKHDRNTSILPEMRGCFGAAARVIVIRYLHGAEDSEGFAALWREIDMAGGRKRRRADKEDALPRNPRRKFGVDVLTLLAHGVQRDKWKRNCEEITLNGRETTEKLPFIALAELRARSYKTRLKMSVHNYILATAGHVDHGKSSLVKALTGTDPDRLPEEKARGITIELGFAHLSLPGFHVGIVDVPGHEDFVKNMVAGVGSIDVALLIVAADDGWMPQTEEHLQILSYLGVTRGVVALTKSDLLESGDARAVAAVRGQLEGTPLSNAPIVKTSVVSGAGMDELKECLCKVLAETPAPRDFGKPRLPVDRVFTLRGVGTVVTGTLSGGVFQRGQQVIIQPRKTATRIRTVQSHNRDVEVSPPGTRTALNLPDIAAGSEAHGVQRGDTSYAPNPWRAGDGGGCVAREISAPVEAGHAGGGTAARRDARARASLQRELRGTGSYTGGRSDRRRRTTHCATPVREAGLHVYRRSLHCA